MPISRRPSLSLRTLLTLALALPLALPLALALALPLAGASACLPPTNPFDPDTPAEQQARATVAGDVVSGGFSSSFAPIVDATVTLTGPSAPAGESLDVNAEDASFARTDLVPGAYELAVLAPGFFATIVDVALLPGDDVERSIVLLPIPDGSPALAHVTGVAQKGAQLLLPAAQQDHGGIVVELSTGERTVTNAAGRYDLFVDAGGLDGSGVVDVSFGAADHGAASIAAVALEAGATKTLSDVVLPFIPASISGSVVVEGGDAAGAVVSVAGGALLPVDALTGAFSVPDLPGGTYVVTAQKDGFVSTSSAAVVVRGGDAAVLGEPLFLERARGSVRGTVALSTGQDPAGVAVALTGTGLGATSGSGDGAFLIERVPVGTHELVAVRDGFSATVRAGVTIVAAGDVVDVGALLLSEIAGDFAIVGGAFTNVPAVTLALDDFDDAFEMMLSEDALFLDPARGDVAYGPFDAAPVFTLAAGADGLRTIFLRVRDVNLVEAGPFSASITLDTAPPTAVSLVVDGGAAFSRSPDGLVVLGVAGSDVAADGSGAAGSGIAQMIISDDDAVLDELPVPFLASVTHQLPDPLVDGPRVVVVGLVDRAGNVSPVPASAAIELDRAAPVLTSFTLDGGAPVTSSEIVLVDVDAAGAALMSLALAGGGVPAFVPFAPQSAFLLPPVDGAHAVFLTLADAAGNRLDEVSATITLDRAAPTSPSIVVAGGAAFTTTRLNVPVALNALGATFMKVSATGDVDAAPLVPFALSAQVTLPDVDGAHVVSAQFFDDAGNASAIVSDTITLDDAPPVLTDVVIELDAAFTRSPIVTVAVVAGGGGPGSATSADLMQIAVDGVVDSEPAIPFAPSTTVTLPALDCPAGQPACKSVHVRLLDLAGNASAVVADDVGLDATPPTTPVIITPSSVESAASIVIEIAAPASDAFFAQYEIAGGPDSLPEFAPFVPDDDDGAGGGTLFTVPLDASADPTSVGNVLENRIRIRARDQAGNVSDESAVVILRDIVAPAAPALAAPPPVQNSDVLSVQLDAAGARGDDATFDHFFLLAVNEAGFASFSGTAAQAPFVFPLVQNELNSLRVSACDAAGQCSAPAVVLVTEDSQPPSAPAITPSAAVINSDVAVLQLASPSLDASGPIAEYQLRGGPFDDFTDTGGGGADVSFVVTPLARDATHELCVRGRDAAGNVSGASCALLENVAVIAVSNNFEEEATIDISGDRVVTIEDLGAGADRLRVRDVRTNGSSVFSEVSARFDPLLQFSDGPPRIAGDIVVWEEVDAGGALTGAVRVLDAFTLLTQTLEPAGLGGQSRFECPDTDGRRVYVRDVDAATPHDCFAGDAPTIVEVELAGGRTTEVAPPAAFSAWRGAPRAACNRMFAAAARADLSGVDLVERVVDGAPVAITSTPGIDEILVAVSCDIVVWSVVGSGFFVRDIASGLTRSVTGLRGPGDASGTRYVFGERTFLGSPVQDLIVYDNRGAGSFVTLGVFGADSAVSPALDRGRVAYIDRKLAERNVSVVDAGSSRFITSGGAAEILPSIVGRTVGYFAEDGAVLTRYDLVSDVETTVSVGGTNGHFSIIDTGAAVRMSFATPPFNFDQMLVDEGGAQQRLSDTFGDALSATAGPVLTWIAPNANNDRVLNTQDVVAPGTQVKTRNTTLFGETVKEMALSIDAGGAVLLAYIDEASGQVRCCPNALASCAAPTTLSTVAGTKTHVRIAASTIEGRGLAVWQNDAAGVSSVDGAFFTAGCTAPSAYFAPGFGNEVHPAVSRDFVVWENRGFANDAEIFAHDLANDGVINLSNDPALQTKPDIAGTSVVWQDTRLGSADVWLNER